MAEAEQIGGPITPAQAECLLVYVFLIGIWSYAEWLSYRAYKYSGDHPHSEASEEQELAPILVHKSGSETTPVKETTATSSARVSTPRIQEESIIARPTFVRLFMLEPTALGICREDLRSAVEMGTIILWFYVADRTPAIAAGPKEYIRDVFLFIFMCLTLVSGSYTMKQGRAPVLINRQQTEEWKGWMQVLFLLYHYYEAREAYNAIRIFIASYVWMTGFGNFAYYYKTKDFSIGRFCQMMWRLNLLAAICCAALNNQYMLYYICPMHTLYTLMVFGALAIWKAGNESATGIWIKIAACFGIVVIMWEFKTIFFAFWSPLEFLLGYTDPRRPNPNPMHEWYFRTGLDRYIWIHGMICAILHSKCEAWLKNLDNETPTKRRAVRGVISAVAVAAGYAWYINIYTLPKIEYNKLHPYTSWIPITAFLVLRNITPKLRLHAMGLYGWLGCITLETYVAQYHTWLLSKVPNSQPIYLLSLLPGYPLLNFSVVTALYIFLSHRLFVLTAALRDAIVPHDDNVALRRNLLAMVGVSGAAWGLGYLLLMAVGG